jgi:phosphate acyltransferase
MKIGLDIMGSDHGPVVPIRAAVMAAKELHADVRLVLIGNPHTIAEGLRAEGADPTAFDIVASEDDITFHDNATKALQAKPKSSIALGFQLLKEGALDAFASTGHTGAMMVGSIFSVKPISGVIRPCIPTVMPKESGGYGIILDVGANADCKPDVLCQFGLLGSLLAESVYGVKNPKVALLNIGEEDKKGNVVTQRRAVSSTSWATSKVVTSSMTKPM